MTNAERYAAIVALLKDEHGEWREDVGGADFIQDVSLIIDEPTTPTPDVDTDSDVNWNNDAIQFPRLLAELYASVDLSRKNWDALGASMDLTRDEITDIFERAQATWDDIKARTK